MQALLSYDRSPPIAAPFRFFLTAPAFGILAGVLLIWAGPNAFLSRWTSEALALTHLVTAGFMLQAMLGALTGRDVAQRMPASITAAVLAAQRGAGILRVHDVAATRDALAVWAGIELERSDAYPTEPD